MKKRVLVCDGCMEPLGKVIIDLFYIQLANEVVVSNVVFYYIFYFGVQAVFCFNQEYDFGLLDNFIVVVIDTGNREEVDTVCQF